MHIKGEKSEHAQVMYNEEEEKRGGKGKKGGERKKRKINAQGASDGDAWQESPSMYLLCSTL